MTHYYAIVNKETGELDYGLSVECYVRKSVAEDTRKTFGRPNHWKVIPVSIVPYKKKKK